MTTTVERTTICALCKNSSKQIEIMSTGAWGFIDLDTRPPEPMRSTIEYFQTCPFCGYCNGDIAKRISGASKGFIASDSCQQQLTDPRFPKLANAYLCNAMIREKGSKYTNAGWSRLRAAWVCDDAAEQCEFNASYNKLKGEEWKDEYRQYLNVACRVEAADLFIKAKEYGQRFGGQTGAEEAVLADILRRSGQFEKALQICETGLKAKPDKTITDILKLQKELINKQDISCHLINEATGDEE